MKRLFGFLACSLFLNACHHSIPPPPPTYTVTCLLQDATTHAAIEGGNCHDGPYSGTTNASGQATFVHVPAGNRILFGGATGYDDNHVTYLNNHDQQIVVTLQSQAPPFPQPATRDQILNVRVTFQGLTVPTQQFGDLPWFEAALAWLNPADRATVYATKHAIGDTHCIIAVPSGRPLYDEPNQPYSADRFPSLDWTQPGDHRLRDLVAEVITQHFIPIVFLDERMPVSYSTLPVVLHELQSAPQGDLTRYVLLLPGWDGVFYGWEPSHTVIPAWAAQARQIAPNIALGLEFNTGHIPLGEGGGDYQPGGLMRDFDVLFVEFNDANLHDDTSWQILGRLLGPAYRRPADQPATDDPHPPYYLQTPNPRGPWSVICFEYGEYEWVRGIYNLSYLTTMKNYLLSLGCPGVS